MGKLTDNGPINSEPNKGPIETPLAFASLFSSANELAALVDAHGRIVQVNGQFLQAVGHSLEDIKGVEFRLWCRPEGDAKFFSAALWQGISELRTIERKQISLRSQLVELSNPDFKGFLFTASPLVEVEQNAQSLHQTRLESLGVLSSSIVHDLNNILTGILGHVSFLRLAMSEVISDKESLFAIEDGARKAASLTHQILEFARGEQLELKPVDLSEVVTDSIKLLLGSIPSTIGVEILSSSSEPYVSGNESQLHQLVLNLAVNARDALPEGGKISIEIGDCSDRDPKVFSGHPVPHGEYVTLCVRDNGMGIASGVKERIFEPFFTTKGQNGTGLGLATVQAIVKAHRGILSVDSAEGSGTAFNIALPKTSLRAEPNNIRKESELPRGSERILIVDDEEAVRTVLQRSLEHLGYEVVVANDGKDALDCYLDDSNGFNLIIVDMIMPRMAGDELFYRLRELDHFVPVLVASGYASDNRTRAVLNDGALGFIQKPFAIEELAEMVRSCLDRQHSEASTGDVAA